MPASIRAVSTVTVGGRECTQRCRSDGHQSGGHPTQPVACCTAGSPPLPAREPVISQKVLVAAARHLDGSRRATGSRASASPAPDRWTYGRRGDAWTAQAVPRQHETAAACSVSATNRQGGRVGLVYMDHAPPVWGCPGPAARPTSACSAEQRARPATAAAAATVFGETAATGGAMSGTGPTRRAGETDSRSPEPVETN